MAIKGWMYENEPDPDWLMDLISPPGAYNYPEQHLSLLCRLQQDRPHRPCSGTCDCCDQPKLCECKCHGR